VRLLEFRSPKTTTVIGPSMCPMSHRSFVKALFITEVCTVMIFRSDCRAESYLKCVFFNYNVLSKVKLKKDEFLFLFIL